MSPSKPTGAVEFDWGDEPAAVAPELEEETPLDLTPPEEPVEEEEPPPSVLPVLGEIVETIDGRFVPLARLQHGRVRARTESMKRLSKRALYHGAVQNPSSVNSEHTKPRARGDCENDGPNAERPCPFVSCKYHLAVDVNTTSGAIKYNMPDVPVEDMRESCTLDVADKGGLTLEDVAQVMNLTRERVRQLETRAINKIRAFSETVALLDYAVDGDGGGHADAEYRREKRKREKEWDALVARVGAKDDDSTWSAEEAAKDVTPAELEHARNILRDMTLPVHARARVLKGAEKAQRIAELLAERGGSFGKATALHVAAHERRTSANVRRANEIIDVARLTWPVLILQLRLYTRSVMESERAHQRAIGNDNAMAPGIHHGMYVRYCDQCNEMHAVCNDRAMSDLWRFCLRCRDSAKKQGIREGRRLTQEELATMRADEICTACRCAPVYILRRSDHRSREEWNTLCKDCRSRAQEQALRGRFKQQRRGV